MVKAEGSDNCLITNHVHLLVKENKYGQIGFYEMSRGELHLLVQLRSTREPSPCASHSGYAFFAKIPYVSEPLLRASPFKFL
jgi:hypothetical protein